jgi:tRNA dimethylallyltransferase
MATTARKTELLAVVGPTASGKSALALKIAQKYGGEIITADSRTIYKGMDIGTDKPTSIDQQKASHWGIDLVEPGTRYSAFKFKKYAQAKLADIQNRGKLPILVGGTGLYVDAVLYNYGFSPPDAERDPQNPRHLKKSKKSLKNELGPGVILIGLLPPDETIKANIAKRAERMLKQGLIEETRRLLQQYGQNAVTGTSGIAYRAVAKLIKGEIDQDQAVELIKTAEWQYARRQKTYFKRNPDIQWFSSADEAYKFIVQSLSN